MYKIDTDRDGDIAEAIVHKEMCKKGWRTYYGARDAPYDFIVEVTPNYFETIQVKKLKNGVLRQSVKRDNQKVTENGKKRNTITYADVGIHWLAGVDIETEEVHYYKLNNYRNIEAAHFTVSKYPADQFPVNEAIRKNTIY